MISPLLPILKENLTMDSEYVVQMDMIQQVFDGVIDKDEEGTIDNWTVLY